MISKHEVRRCPPDQVCSVCGRSSLLISAALGVCRDCIRTCPDRAIRITSALHGEARRAFDLPASPPRTPEGVRCTLCVRECVIGEGERGYCGLRTARQGRLVHLAGTPQRGILEWYRDPLPTNCVADWVCAGSRQTGYHNLAVFYSAAHLIACFAKTGTFGKLRQQPGMA